MQAPLIGGTTHGKHGKKVTNKYKKGCFCSLSGVHATVSAGRINRAFASYRGFISLDSRKK